MNEVKLYAERDLMEMDRAGNHHCRHVDHMTREKLHSKSDIAAELGWRDMQIAALQQQLTATTNSLTNAQEALKSAGIEADTVPAGVMELVSKLAELEQELEKECDILIDTAEQMRQWKHRAEAAESNYANEYDVRKQLESNWRKLSAASGWVDGTDQHAANNDLPRKFESAVEMAASWKNRAEAAEALNSHLELAVRKAEVASEALRRRAEEAENKLLFTRPAPAINLNAVRAEGVDIAVNDLKELAKRSLQEAPNASEHTHAAALYLMTLAAQLRTGNAGKDGSHE